MRHYTLGTLDHFLRHTLQQLPSREVEKAAGVQNPYQFDNSLNISKVLALQVNRAVVPKAVIIHRGLVLVQGVAKVMVRW